MKIPYETWTEMEPPEKRFFLSQERLIWHSFLYEDGRPISVLFEPVSTTISELAASSGKFCTEL